MLGPLLTLMLMATALGESGSSSPKPRKADPALGSKASTFAKNVFKYLAYKPYPQIAGKAQKALEAVAALENRNWKGIGKLLNKSWFRPRAGKKKYRNVLTKKVDGLPVTYYLNLPGGYNPRRAWPLAIALHGGGAGAGDGTEAMGTFGTLMGPRGAIVAAPTAPELVDGAWNYPRGYRVVRELIREMCRTYHVDGNRIYVGGHSMGGYGSYFESIRWPDRFAACLSSAGGITAGSVCDFEALYNTPLFVIHGTEDHRQAPIAFVRAADKAISLLPLKPRFYSYVEIPGAGHGFPTRWRKEATTKMWRHTRDPYPKKVVCVCPAYWSSDPGREMGSAPTSRAFWVEILERDGRDFNTPAKVIGEWGKDPNVIVLSTPPIRRVVHKGPRDINLRLQDMPNRVRKIGVCLSEDFVDLSKPIRVQLNGATVFHGLVNRSAAYLLDHLVRTDDPAMAFSARIIIDVP
jgi:predicted esterase